jgi:transcriptional regulator with XRE-family HTH domain
MQAGGVYCTRMVTRIRTTRPHRVYLAEWMAKLGTNDERLAGRLNVARETVTRYRNYPNRLNPAKLAQIAEALDIEVWRLWQDPARPSIDELLAGQDNETVERIARSLDALGVIRKTGT